MKKSRKLFGLTPWGDYFLNAMEDLADEKRLARGTSYAKNDKLISFSLENALVKAKVRGKSRPSYTVVIGFKPFSAGERIAILAAVENDPMFLGRILAGELPLELRDLLARSGVNLLPDKWKDMKRACSCPDYGDPCKHMAAVYYLIAQEIDRDPFFIFRLRDLDLRKEVGIKEDEEILPPVLLKTADKPWPVFEGAPEFPACENYTSLVLGILPSSPPLAPFDMKEMLKDFYTFAAGAKDNVYGAEVVEGAEIEERKLSRAETEIHMRDTLQDTELIVRDEEGCVLNLYGAVTAAETTVFAFCRRFLSFTSDNGSPSYRFFFYFSRAMFILLKTGAFVPDVYMKDDAFRIIYKPARFGKDIQDLLTSVETLLPPCVFLKKGKAKPVLMDRASSFGVLAVLFLSDFVRAIGFMPETNVKRTHPLTLAFFLGLKQPVSHTELGGLPYAIDRWLSVFDITEDRNSYEIMIEGPEKGAMALSVYVTDANKKRLLLKDAAAAAGPDILKFPAMLSGFLPELKSLGARASVPLEDEPLFEFITTTSPIFSRLGVTIVLPRELRTIAAPKPIIVAKKTGMQNLKTFLDLESILSFEWKISLGDTVIDLKEFKKLVKAGTTLVRFNDQYIRITPDEAAAIMRQLARAPMLTPVQMLEEVFAGNLLLDQDVAPLFDNLFKTKDREIPEELKAELRPYQVRGFLWAYTNLLNGLGCIIADDMGLGKTVQAITVILALKGDGKIPKGALIIVPASLCANWERELERFAPSLSVLVYMGASRKLCGSPDVLITSYQTFLKDKYLLEERDCDLFVLDEAHIIKNPNTKQSKAVRQVSSSYRLALSGTPVENNLAELWSIFDYALPGYLGNLKNFAETYRVPIEIGRDRERAERLKKITAPLMLRRLKTDASVITDLPEKISMDEYAVLTVKQAALYESVTSDAVRKIESAEKQDRLPLILKLIVVLKQICNHPRNYDKQSSFDPKLSGKTELLLTLLEEILERGEKVLVFSQYREMLEILNVVIRESLGTTAFMLHGGMQMKKRMDTVDRFQSAKGGGVFLISLKAGGTGLNLTAASHVIHYDLWFNPAVENQATDRAFRIGQKNNVCVHRFITKGTFEEKLNAMIASKRELTEMTVAAGESWIADMGDRELRDLFLR